MRERVSDRIVKAFQDYLANYRKGCEQFGFWWKLFTVSMLALALVLISFAMILIFRFVI